MTARELRRVAGYILQDDVLPGTSTVREYMFFHARMRLPVHASEEECRERVRDSRARGGAAARCAPHAPVRVLVQVNEVISLLGLEHVSESLIGDEFVRGIRCAA